MLQELANWIAVLGTWLLAAYFFGFLIYHTLKKTSSTDSWFLTVIERNFAATIAVPLSAISSACIVVMLEATTGEPIVFEALTVKFSGASGPVVLWVFCFSVMILAVKVLWRD